MAASIGCSFSGVGFLLQNHYPRSTGAPSCRFRTLTRRPPSVDSGLTMPFLDTIEAADVAALRSLHVAVTWSTEDLDLDDVLAYPTLDGGITDYWAKALSTVSTVFWKGGADMLDRLLSPDSVTIEERQIALPLTGSTDLTFIRVDVEGSAGRSIGLLADVLVWLDSVMAAPFPHVVYRSSERGWGLVRVQLHVSHGH